MKSRLPLLALVSTVLMGCSDPGDEWVSIKGSGQGSIAVQVSQQDWELVNGTWTCRPFKGYETQCLVAGPEDAKKVQAYMDSR